VCGKGDIDTAAIRSYSSGLAASSLKEWGASCKSTRQDCTRPASSKVYKDIGKDDGVLVVTRPQTSRRNKSRSVVVVGIMLAWGKLWWLSMVSAKQTQHYKLAPAKVASVRKRQPALREEVRRARKPLALQIRQRQEEKNAIMFLER
jgi:hypothetical protein